MTKKIFAMFLAVLMVVSMLPTSVFAAENGCPGETVAHSLKNCTTYEAVAVKEANCGEGGYTTYLCTECGRTFIDSRTEKVGEHDYSKAAEDVEPTCTTPGSKGGLECTKCGDVIGAEEVDPLGEGLSHEWGEWNATEFDCTKDFEMERKCLHCSAVDPEEYEAADGAKHTFGEWEKVEGTNTARRYCTNKHEGLWKCNAYEETTIVSEHLHDKNTLTAVEAENCDPTAEDFDCTKGGVAAHYICRECGKLFDLSFVETTLEKLTGKSEHETLKDGLTCLDTSVQCDYCDEIITAEDEHEYTPWEEVSAPTCVLNGFQKKTCVICGDAKTEVIPALGHEEYSYTVPATCGQYAYTFSYCVRPGCKLQLEATQVEKDAENEDVSFVLNVGSNDLTAPVIGLEFYLNLFQGNAEVNKTLYFNGKMAGYYLGTTADKADAVMVTLVPATEIFEGDGKAYVVEGAYWMTFVDAEGNTKYINIYEYEENEVGVTIADAPENYFTWSEKYNTLTVSVKLTNGEIEERYLGTYNKYTTISSSNVSYLEGDSAQYVAKMTIFNGEKVALMSFDADIAAGMDETNHDLKSYFTYPSTCEVAGYEIKRCARCGYLTEELPLELKEHNYDVKSDLDATCTAAGLIWKVCKDCGFEYKETPAATGHTAMKAPSKGTYYGKKYKKGETIVDTTDADHNTPYTFDFYYCDDCGEPFGYFNRQQAEEFKFGYIYNNLEAAQKDHELVIGQDDEGNDIYSKLVEKEYVPGTCTADGYRVYICEDGCGNEVKVYEHDTEGEHLGYSDAIVGATCTEEEHFLAYICNRTGCGKLVGADQGAKAEGDKVVTGPALGHDWEENEDYVASSCDAPNMDEDTNYSRYCDRCGIKDHDYEVLFEKELAAGEYLCTSYTYIVYSCKEHGSHSYNFVGNYDHVYELVVGSTNPATCIGDGSYVEKCKYCGDEQTKTIPMIQHENAAGEKFWSDCLSEEMDRHCVLCCKRNAHDKLENHDCTADQNESKEGVQTCDCVIEAGKHDYKLIPVLPTCDAMPYHYEMCTKCYDTTKAVFDTEAFVGLNADGSKKYIDVVLGHRPVEAGSDKYYGYVYMEFGPYVDYVYVGDVLTAVPMDAYDAMYIEYKAPTRTEAGYEKYECAVCGEIHEKVLEVNTEVEFNAEIQEGDYTYGSVVEVVITVDGASQKMDSFTFVVNATNMVYIGCDATINLDFAVDATVKKDGTVVVTGWNGENVAIDGEIELIKLQFRVNANENKEENIAVSMTQFESFEMATYLNEEGKPTAFKAAFTGDKADTRMLMDVDGNSTVTFRDVVYLSQMVQNGEYDVVCDINGNGEIDLQDLVEARQLYVGNVTAEELAVKYLGAEMAKLMGINVCEDCGAVDCTEKHTA